jgi:hypothetical protein
LSNGGTQTSAKTDREEFNLLAGVIAEQNTELRLM